MSKLQSLAIPLDVIGMTSFAATLLKALEVMGDSLSDDQLREVSEQIDSALREDPEGLTKGGMKGIESAGAALDQIFRR